MVSTRHLFAYLKNLFISPSILFHTIFLWQLIKFRFFISSLMKELIILYYYCFVGIFSLLLFFTFVVFLFIPIFFYFTYCRFSTSALFTTYLMVTFVFSSWSMFKYLCEGRREEIKEFKWIELGGMDTR